MQTPMSTPGTAPRTAVVGGGAAGIATVKALRAAGVPVVGFEHAEPPIPVWALTIVTLVVVLVGVGLAYRQYAVKEIPAVAPAASALTVAARRDLYGDAFNEVIFMGSGQVLTKSMAVVEDKALDGAVRGVAVLTLGSSTLIRRLQTGYVRSYALAMFAGAAVVIAVMLLGRM